ncbi:MAG: phosphoenolpyruvate-utilizing N-terminal domain-containing protein, partial [Pusillimonas sp.]
MVRGYAIGRAVVMGAAALEVVHYRIQPEDVEAECQRLKYALVQAQGELQHMIDHLPDDAPREMGPLLTVHCMLLADRMLSEQACLLIAERLYNAEWALTTQGQTLAEQFAAIEDEYLRERGADIRQVIERVLRVLSGRPVALPDFQSVQAGELIVVARDISPA